MAVKQKENFNKMRLWGKILGTGADYWVAEATGEPGEIPPEFEGLMDQPGERGANQYTYFVTTDLADEWRKLPDIKYEDVVSARRIRRLFTGNPDAKVITH